LKSAPSLSRGDEVTVRWADGDLDRVRNYYAALAVAQTRLGLVEAGSG
jgi:hypothetical protein